MSDPEYLRATQEAEAQGEFVSAIYHSHFGQGCYLSQDDLAFAAHPLFPFPFAAQLVVSLLGEGITEVGIFEKPGDPNGRFVGRRLEAIS
jgi:proteasome lid subunit RPN8/RPN11